MDALTPDGPALEVEVRGPGEDEDPSGTVTVVLRGELDMSNISRADGVVAPRLANEPRRVVVKAGDLTFADSSAIALWLRWAASVERFELHDASPLLQRVLTSMGLAEKLGLTR